jgi:SAM-dependent methyltransferase
MPKRWRHKLDAQDSIRQYYDEEYYGTKRDQSTGRSMRRARNNLRGMYIKQGDRFIDVGCGLGIVGRYLTNQGAVPLGIDISLKAAQMAWHTGGYIALVQANAEKLPLGNALFDGATFMGTLEHFRYPDKALQEVIRVLKPGAQICFVVPNSGFFLFRFLKGTGQPHEVPRTCAGWRRLFKKAGLEVELLYRDVGPNFFEGGILRGLVRKFVLSAFNLLPIRYTYQFVFICRR